jgi:hypothetical protein
MRLSEKSLSRLAEMICGSNGSIGGFTWQNFPYRSSTYLSEFFTNAGLPHRHGGGASRKWWVLDMLKIENATAFSNPKLPPDSIIVIVQTLLDGRTFEENKRDRAAAINDVNEVLKWDGLRVFVGDHQLIQIEAIQGHASSVGTIFAVRRAWTAEELKSRQAAGAFLISASEDEITEKLLVPLFLHLGFERISVTGHKDKRLEYGTDLWMKFKLPRTHEFSLAAR